MARPKAIIDWKRVDQMLMSQCSTLEIASSLGIDENTLYRACQRDHKIGFGLYSQQKKAKGHATAREVFYKQAWIDKNDGQQATRQIFWLKNYAGMSDKQEIKQTITERTVLELPSNGTGPESEPLAPPPRPTDSIP
jgi:IS30 family transposase